MSKLSSYLVFLFGLGLMGLLIFTVAQRFLQREKAPEVRLHEMPVSGKPALELTTYEGFVEKVGKLYKQNGMEEIKAFVEKEFVPGRKLLFKSLHASEPDRAKIVLDREMRRCDQQGVTLMELAPVVPRGGGVKIDGKVELVTWQHTRIREPVTIVTWCVPTEP